MERPSDRRQPLSNRFLPPTERRSARIGQAWSSTEVFAEGQWQSLRSRLEGRGWSTTQIEQIHDQLRQGWPLSMAENNVSITSGHCPIRARHP